MRIWKGFSTAGTHEAGSAGTPGPSENRVIVRVGAIAKHTKQRELRDFTSGFATSMPLECC